MHWKQLLCAALPALLLACAGPGPTARSGFEEDFDNEDKPWEEVALQLPAAPQDKDLLPFEVSGNASQAFAIDPKSLSAGADGVVRYTLLAVSPAGARNVSYEGIRCETFEKKLYAVGHADGSWTRARRSEWDRIVRNAANRQHAVLAIDYFCDSKMVAGNPRQILDRIRYQRPVNRRVGD